MKLKGYKQLPIDKVFLVNNMQIRFEDEKINIKDTLSCIRDYLLC